MSQKKVDEYKIEKANRKKTMKRNKIKKAIAVTFVWIVFLGLIGWAGYSGYQLYESKKPEQTYTVKTDAINDFLKAMQE